MKTGLRIPAPGPVYSCEGCGKTVRMVNVCVGRLLCRDCTILELRRLDDEAKV